MHRKLIKRRPLIFLTSSHVLDRRTRYLFLYITASLTPRLGRTGTHRYTFLLFREPAGGVNFTTNDFHWTDYWDAFKFAEQKGLKLVGANFFLIHT